MRLLFPPRCDPRAHSRSASEDGVRKSPLSWRGSTLTGLRWLIFSVGYLLSPFTLWNDAFLNLPLSLVFGGIVSRLTGANFLAASAVAYVFTNVLGLLLMFVAALGTQRSFLKREAPAPPEENVSSGAAIRDKHDDNDPPAR